MLRYRLTLGPILIVALAAVFWLDQALTGGGPGSTDHAGTGLRPGSILLLLGLAITPIAAWELKHMLRATGIKASRGVLLFGAIVGLLLPWLVPHKIDAVTAVAITASAATAVYVYALVWHSRTRTSQGVTAAAGSALLAFVYLGLMLGFILALRREHPAWIVLGVLVVTKSCDIGAFTIGKMIGRHKLIPWLSPGKTWEGLAGGIVTAGAMGSAAVYLLHQTDADLALADLSIWTGAAYGAVFAVTGQAGDLMASLLKRDAGIKDSGRILPGFGGVLDVIDSLLPVGPVAYWLLHRG